jgi:hypothetical protein
MKNIIIIIILLFSLGCSKPLYYENIKKMNEEIKNSNHIIYLVTYGHDLSQEIYLTIYDKQNNKVYYVDKKNKNEFNINKISDSLDPSFKFEFNNFINNQCDILTNKGIKSSMSGAYSNSLIYEIKDKKIRKCEYRPFYTE